MMKSFLALILCFFSLLSFAQTSLTGTVQDKKRTPIFAANVYLKSSPQTGVTTDFAGEFSLNVPHLNDTLIISFIGFKTKEIPLSAIDAGKKITVVLKENVETLEEVIIKAKAPISEQFSVTKMERLKDVYLNPVAQGDFLKAITSLPVSTTVDETANPSLRGSSPSRSRVVLNGVPIYRPTKSTNLNNQGFFSLFNAEVVDKQYVYASNPPLTYGNTSAGLVEIQTITSLEANQLQLSATLASAGIFLSQRIKKDISFIQVYGNYQFSDAYAGIQKDKLPNIKNFYINDTGINFHIKIGKRSEFNSYNYFINEKFNGYSQSFTYKGDVSTSGTRIFTVNNFKYHSEKGVLSINSGVDNADQNFEFGNLKSEQKINQIYTSIDYKWHLLKTMNLQFGVSHNYHGNGFKDSIPTYYYAMSPSSPADFSGTSIQNHILEAYAYVSWDANDKFTVSSGVRTNLPVENQKYYFSAQLALKYRLNERQSLLLSGGRYHNYSIPGYFSKNYNLLSSNQVALDYTYEFKNIVLKAASYFKNEAGENQINAFFRADIVNTVGVEFYLKYDFYKYFEFSVSNSFIDQKIKIGERSYKGSKNFNYLVRSTIKYNNPRLFALALTYIGRPGIYYNEIVGSRRFDPLTNFYEPNFSNLANAQFESYNRFDISLSKYIPIKRSALVIFISANNVFNFKNESSALYNEDYSSKYFDYYQFRLVYFGLVWSLNY